MHWNKVDSPLLSTVSQNQAEMGQFMVRHTPSESSDVHFHDLTKACLMKDLKCTSITLVSKRSVSSV